MSEYLDDAKNLADLILKMPVEDQEVFRTYGHMRVQAGFVGRLFVLYRPSGLEADKSHKKPEILTTIRVDDFQCDSDEGATASLTDLTTGQTQIITYVPDRVFEYPVFMSMPPVSRLRWDAKPINGQIQRSLTFGFLAKTKNRSDFYSIGNVYMETPNDFKALYPNHELNTNFA